MEKVSCLPLDSLISMMQTFEKQYGGNIPVLLADKSSPNAIVPVVDAFMIEIVDKNTNDKQQAVVVSDFVVERTG